uniref:Uncharacterized protein n=1 Tax=Rhizophora mucronata TaxID=61149 RepID=A0A2P2QNZ4_RHIMU
MFVSTKENVPGAATPAVGGCGATKHKYARTSIELKVK